MAYKTILFEERDSLAIVHLNRPDKLNALNAEVMSSLKAMVAWVEATDSIRVVVLTGAQPNEPPEGKRAKWEYIKRLPGMEEVVLEVEEVPPLPVQPIHR